MCYVCCSTERANDRGLAHASQPASQPASKPDSQSANQMSICCNGFDAHSTQAASNPTAANISDLMDKLSASELGRLRLNVAAVSAVCNGKISIGSLLSGTDCQFFMWQCLMSLIERRFGIFIEIDMKFSCDNVEYVQKFIQMHLGQQHTVYPDVHKLASDPDTCEDIKGSVKPLPDVTVLIFAIECDSVSSLSSGWSSRLQCIEEGDTSSRTGGSAISCLRIIERMLPPMIICECVKNLMAQIDSVLTPLWEMGYLATAHVVNSNAYGCPQSRERVYIVGVYIGKEEAIRQEDPDEYAFPVLDEYAELLSLLELPCPRGLKEYLLPESSAAVIAANQANERVAPEPPKKTKTGRPKKKAAKTAKAAPSAPTEEREEDEPDKCQKFELDHMHAYQNNKLPWPPTYTVIFEKKAKPVGHSARMTQLLFLDEKVTGPTESLDALYTRDLNMSGGWGKEKKGSLSCVVSSSWVWVRGLLEEGDGDKPPLFIDRLMTGNELLAVQGMSHEWLHPHIVDELSLKELITMAGNMFNVETLAAVALSALFALPVAEAVSLYNADGCSDSQSQDAEDDAIVVEDSQPKDGESGGGILQRRSTRMNEMNE